MRKWVLILTLNSPTSVFAHEGEETVSGNAIMIVIFLILIVLVMQVIRKTK